MKDLLHLLKVYGKKQIKTFYWAIFGVLLIKALSIIPPILTGKILDDIKDTKSVLPLLILLVLVTIIKMFFSPFQTKQLNSVIQNIIRDASVDWSQRILNKEYSFFQGLKIGSLMRSSERGIQSYEKFLVFAIVILLPCFVEVIFIGSYLIYLTGVAITSTLLVCSILFISLIYHTINWRRPYILAVNDAEDDVGDCFAETLQNARTIKSFGAIKNASRGLFSAYEKYAQSSTALSYASEFVKSLRGAFVSLVSIGVLTIGILMQKGGGVISVGDFVVIFTFAALFMNNISTLIEAYQALDEFKTDKIQFDKILNLPEYRNEENAIELDDQIVCPNLTVSPFEFKMDGKLLLRNLDEFKIPFGSKVAIVGETGSGKTTFASIISGVHKVQDTIRLDSFDLTNLSAKSLTDHLGSALQDPEFLSGPLKRTVMLDHFDVSDEFLKYHGGKLGLDKIIPQSQNFEFSTKGISGGEAKRLSLLRAVAANRPINLLDEPTSALDDQKASEVWDHLFSHFADKTLVCITHDTQNLYRFDHVIRIDNGCVTVV